jgi:UDP-N-acetylglucosamine:LPS N-acetylglucosamine transferase
MKNKPRVLLLSASSGAGHLRAAQALEKALGALLDDPARLKQMREAARLMARPNAAADIAQDALALVN